MRGRGAGRRALLAVGILLLALTVLAVPVGGQGRTLEIAVPEWALPDEVLRPEELLAETGITARRVAEVGPCEAASRTDAPPPGILLLHEWSPARLRTGDLVLPLDDLLAADPELAADLPGLADWVLDGATVAIPAREMPLMLEVDRAHLATAGFAEPPATWADLLDQARTLRASGTDPHPIAFAPIEWTWALIAASLGDPLVDAAGRPTFAEPDAPGRVAMGILLTMLREELIAPAIGEGTETQHTWFWSGRGTFHQGWAGSLPAARHPSGGRGDAVTYLTLPDTGRTVSVPRGFAIPADAPDPDAARTFLTWILRPEIQRDLFRTTGVIPARRSVTEALVAEGRVADGATLLAQLGNVGRMPWAVPGWPALSERIAMGIADAAEDGTSADILIDAIAADWDRVPPAACAP